MTIKNWVLLLFMYILYLCLGGMIFNYLECPNYKELNKSKTQRLIALYLDLSEFRTTLSSGQVQAFNDILYFFDISDNETSINTEDCEKWDFYNSLFFSFTAVTTIGYGHQAPLTNFGRVFCVFYSLFGIPLNAILIGALGNLFSDKVLAMKRKAVTAGSLGLQGISKVGQILMELFFLFIIFTSLFLFLPAALFTYSGLEDKTWDYVDSLYYTFITLSTIGFGDMVAGRKSVTSGNSDVKQMLYQIAIIVWILFGLGYLFGVVNVITEAMQSSSKPVKRAIRGLKNQIHVQDYWRKIIHEIVSIKKDQTERWLSEELLEVGAGGGSEPCLGFLALPDESLGMKRSASTGDLDEGESNMGTSKVENIYSLQHLPDTSNYLQDIQELNEDTITSLRNFLITARVGNQGDTLVSSWVENNFPGDMTSLPSTQPVSRHQSKSRLHYARSLSQGERSRHRRTSMHNPRKFSRRYSSISGRSTTSSNGTATIGLLLEQTTLVEFLSAVENVRAKSEAEIRISMEKERNSQKGKMSVFRRLSLISRSGNLMDNLNLSHPQVSSRLRFQKKEDEEQATRGDSEQGIQNPLVHPPPIQLPLAHPTQLPHYTPLLYANNNLAGCTKSNSVG